MGRNGTYKRWRREMLSAARSSKKQGTNRFEWMTAGDDVVCPKCKARAGRLFWFKDLEAELEGEFCTPGDPDDRCRCVLLPSVF